MAAERNDWKPEELQRYGRHLTLPEVGLAGQRRLRNASVALVGAGGLGSPAAIYLVAAGVGRVGLIDFDEVELSNLQRQVLYGTADLGGLKVERARCRLGELNPHVRIEPHAQRLTAENAMDLLRSYDVVLDGTDNFATRYLVNDACVLLGKPNVYGSIFRFEGQVSVFWAGRGPCYRCLYPEPPAPGAVPSCAEGGVLGVLPGIIGSLQAAEALKLLLERGRPLVGRLLLCDALEMRFREMTLRASKTCPVCGPNPRIREPAAPAADPCAAAAPTSPSGREMQVEELKRRLDRGEPLLLLDVRTPEEWAICRLPQARLFPLPRLAERLGELDAAHEIVVYCHVGTRSAMAVDFLTREGFRRAYNLAGGIDAWSERVDPTLPRY